jgi:hypothetical protein
MHRIITNADMHSTCAYTRHSLWHEHTQQIDASAADKPTVLTSTSKRPSSPHRERLYKPAHFCLNSLQPMTGERPPSHANGIPEPTLRSTSTLFHSRCSWCCNSARNLHATALAVYDELLPCAAAASTAAAFFLFLKVVGYTLPSL